MVTPKEMYSVSVDSKFNLDCTNLYLVHTGGNIGVEYHLNYPKRGLKELFEIYKHLETLGAVHSLDTTTRQIAERIEEVGKCPELETIQHNLFLFEKIWRKMTPEEQNTVKPLLTGIVLRRLRLIT
jgi:hypothetical protein